MEERSNLPNEDSIALSLFICIYVRPLSGIAKYILCVTGS